MQLTVLVDNNTLIERYFLTEHLVFLGEIPRTNDFEGTLSFGRKDGSRLSLYRSIIKNCPVQCRQYKRGRSRTFSPIQRLRRRA